MTKNLLAFLYGSGLADVQTHTGIELQGITTGGGFWIAEHDTNLLTQLVDEDAGGIGLGYGGSELAKRLAHESSLQANLVVAHIAFDFCLGSKGCHRVYHHNVDGC